MFSSNLQGDLGEREREIKGAKKWRSSPKDLATADLLQRDSTHHWRQRPSPVRPGAGGARPPVHIVHFCLTRATSSLGARARAGGAWSPVHIVPHPCSLFAWCGSRAGQGQAARDLDAAVGPGNAWPGRRTPLRGRSWARRAWKAGHQPAMDRGRNRAQRRGDRVGKRG
jgi:hypothetical protein